MDFSKLTYLQIEAAVKENDLDEAVRIIQDGIGQDDGGVASIHFSGGEGGAWPFLSAKKRRQMIFEYLETEKSYDGLYAPIKPLYSVGSGIDRDSLLVYAALKDGGYDMNTGTYLNDCTVDWVLSLSAEDAQLVKSLREQFKKEKPTSKLQKVEEAMIFNRERCAKLETDFYNKCAEVSQLTNLNREFIEVLKKSNERIHALAHEADSEADKEILFDIHLSILPALAKANTINQ